MTTKNEHKYKGWQRLLIVGSGTLLLVIAIVAVTILTANIASNHFSKRVAVIHITSRGFVPATLTVQKDTKVTWINDDKGIHQVKANPFPGGTDLPSLNSAILNNSQSYTYQTKSSGNFGYHDQLNPTINGSLTVK